MNLIDKKQSRQESLFSKLIIPVIVIFIAVGCTIVGKCIIINSTDQPIEIKTYRIHPEEDKEDEGYYFVINPNEQESFNYNIYGCRIIEISVEEKRIFQKELPLDSVQTTLEIKPGKSGPYEIIETIDDL